jgi:MIP family channel proteins
MEAATTVEAPRAEITAAARPDLARRAGAEGIAAFFLVFAGCGAAVTNAVYGGALGQVGIALTFGLVIMAMVYATGHLSGAHINPAVTIAFALTRHFPAREAAAYIVAQALGATAGALVLLAVWPDQPAQLGATVPSIGAGGAFVYEAILTAFLMFVIMAVATDTRAVGAAAAIAIGGTVGLDALFGGPVTGASMNPARSLGPAVAAGEFTDFWLYIAGPILGAALGAFAYQLVRGEPAGPQAADAQEGGEGDGARPVRLPA